MVGSYQGIWVQERCDAYPPARVPAGYLGFPPENSFPHVRTSYASGIPVKVPGYRVLILVIGEAA
eukprot:3796067-Rhodomonas_salina.1